MPENNLQQKLSSFTLYPENSSVQGSCSKRQVWYKYTALPDFCLGSQVSWDTARVFYSSRCNSCASDGLCSSKAQKILKIPSLPAKDIYLIAKYENVLLFRGSGTIKCFGQMVCQNILLAFQQLKSSWCPKLSKFPLWRF